MSIKSDFKIVKKQYLKTRRKLAVNYQILKIEKPEIAEKAKIAVIKLHHRLLKIENKIKARSKKKKGE